MQDLKIVGADQSVSNAQLNWAKNRYINDYPYDNTRITLMSVGVEDGTDYINGSWMPVRSTIVHATSRLTPSQDVNRFSIQRLV